MIPTTSIGDPRPGVIPARRRFTLNNAMTAMTFSATIFNIDFTEYCKRPSINDNLVVAHIHASPTVTPTTNGPVVWGFFGAPFDDNNPNDILVTPLSVGVGGTISGKWDEPEEATPRRLLRSCRTSCRITRTSTSIRPSSAGARFAAQSPLFPNLPPCSSSPPALLAVSGTAGAGRRWHNLSA